MAFITKHNEKYRVNSEISNRLKEISELKEELDNEERELRTNILNELQEHSIDSISDNNFTFSQIIPKPKSFFDEESFLLKESEDVVACFTTVKKITKFDEERFIAEHKDIYDKYLKTEFETITDVKSLEKNLPIVFKKYNHEEPSDKPVSLRIAKKRGK